MSLLDNSTGITEIYSNYKPAFNNLYEIEISGLNGESLTSDINSYIKFHAPTVTFDGESLSLERNSITKNFQLSENNAFNRASSLSITWREDESWKVKKYHDDWLACFYDKDNDCYISYPYDINGDKIIDNYKFNGESISRKDLYRTIKIKMPSVFDKTERIITFYKVLPNQAPGLSLGWSTSGDIVTHQLTYYVRDWEWEK